MSEDESVYCVFQNFINKKLDGGIRKKNANKHILQRATPMGRLADGFGRVQSAMGNLCHMLRPNGTN